MRILKFLAVSLAMVLAIEVAVRAITYRSIDVIDAGPELYYYTEKPALIPGPFGDHVPGRTLWVVDPPRPYEVRVNRQGLRNVEDVDPRATKILAIGDSNTFGPYVENAGTWPAFLERALRNRGYGPIQVLNAGVAGYDIRQETSYLVEKGLALKPALVLLGFSPNDLGDLRRDPPRFPRPDPRQDNALRALARKVAVVRVTHEMIRKYRVRQEARATAGPTGSMNTAAAARTPEYDEYTRLFRALVETVRRANVPFGVVVFTEAGERGCEPMRENFIVELAGRFDVPVINMVNTYQAYTLEELYHLYFDASRPPGDSCFADSPRYVGNGHLSRFGNLVTARAVADWLVAQRLVPRPAGS